MKVNVESLSSTEKKLEVWIPAEEVKNTYEDVLGEFQRSARLKGFRQGRAPRRVIESMFAKSIVGEVSQKLVHGSIERAFAEASLSPVSSPDVRPDELHRDGEFHYTVEFEVLPEFELGSYRGIGLTRDTRSVGDEDVDEVLSHLQERGAHAKPLEEPREVGKGDLVVVDYEGLLEGRALPELTQEGVELIVGEERLVPEFDEGIMGMRKGEEKEIEVAYPEDFQIEEAAGKTVAFKLVLKDIMERVLPEIDDEFASDLGAENLVSLKARVREDRERELERARRNRMRNDILEHLNRNNTFDVPRSLVSGEVARIRRDIESRFHRVGTEPPELDEKTEEEVQRRAEANVRASVILGKIAEREGIEVTREEVDERLAEVAKSVNMSFQEVSEIYREHNLLVGLESRILEDKVVDFLIENAEIGHVEGGEVQIDKES